MRLGVPEPTPSDPRVLGHVIAQDARTTGSLVLFADYERALCSTPPNGRVGGIPLLTRGALVALAGTPCTRVVVVSTQDVADLETHVNVPGVVYAGCRGLQIRQAGIQHCHPATAAFRQTVPLVADELSRRLASVSGVEVEVKELGVTIHLRRADPLALPTIIAHAATVRETPAGRFRIWSSAAAVDLFPDVDGHSGSNALWMLEPSMPLEQRLPIVVYLGGENAAALPHAATFAIHVGRPRSPGAASLWLVDQAAAADLLARVAFEWGARSSSP